MSERTLFQLIKQISDEVNTSSSFTNSEKKYAKEIMSQCSNQNHQELISQLIQRFEKIDLDIEPFLKKHNFYK